MKSQMSIETTRNDQPTIRKENGSATNRNSTGRRFTRRLLTFGLLAALFFLPLNLPARAQDPATASGAVKVAYDVYKGIRQLTDQSLQTAIQTVINEVYKSRDEALIGQADGFLWAFRVFAAGKKSEADLSALFISCAGLKGTFETILRNGNVNSAHALAPAYNLLIPMMGKLMRLRSDPEASITNLFSWAMATNYAYAGAFGTYVFMPEGMIYRNTIRAHRLWQYHWEQIPSSLRSIFPYSDVARMADSYYNQDPVAAGVRQAMNELMWFGYRMGTESKVLVSFPAIVGGDRWVETNIQRTAMVLVP